MPDSVQVLEEAQIERPRPMRDRRAWASVVVTFAVGVAFGAVFFGPVVDPGTDPDDAADDGPVAPGEEVGPVGLARAIPGMPDAVVAIVASQDAGIEYLLWPLARGPSTRSLPAGPGASVSIDPSGGWVAVLTPVPDSEGGLLSTGRSTAVRPVASGVDSYAWNDSAPGNIGFLRFHEGSWGLWRASAYPVPGLEVDLGGEYPGELVAFGDWGWALQRPGSFRVVSPNGSSRDYEGRLLDVAESAFLSLVSGDVMLYDALGGADLVADQTPGVMAAAFSPDRSQVAILYPGAVTVVSVDGSAPPIGHRLPPQTGSIVWSSDAGFILASLSPRGLRVIDVRTGQTWLHLTDYTVIGVGVVPLSGS